MNLVSDMVSHVFSSTEITTKYIKPSYETTSMGIILTRRTIVCSTNHNVASHPPTDSDSDDDITIISQAIKKRRTTTSNTVGPTTRLLLTLSPRFKKIRSFLVLPIWIRLFQFWLTQVCPLLTETRMPFNSHLIVKDITEAERNFDVDDFLVDHDPAQNSDCELALTNNYESVEELKAKLTEAEDIYENLRRSIQHTIDEVEKEEKQYVDLFIASKNRDEARVQAEATITARHASWGAIKNSIFVTLLFSYRISFHIVL
ncbi:hypothetical protein FNV43_RR05978 [Rhamnella rubrinervis]|uniref:Uncharacterized protein n=1 Tax=Rhamnella rubrinervis TaxID=2594499 RepID=A0A8K0MKZ3_9ROSA|nr:hypothetical protein FNV43_RR05978 [Rhamnella rubrinervis]